MSDEQGFDTLEESHETPVTARARVLRYGNLLISAELDLKRARDEEIEAERTLRVARVKAQLAPDAPKRGEGFTVADKKAWVDARVEDEAFKLEVAKVKRQTAFDHYQRVDKQASLAQSILKSIDNSFAREMGRDEPRIPGGWR